MGSICQRPKEELTLSRTVSFEANVEYLRIMKSPQTSAEFDDLSMDFAPSFISSDECSVSRFKRTSTLPQIVKFKIGGRVLCMSWNMQHDFNSSAFDYYWNPWSVTWLREEERVLIANLWDVAEVFFNLDGPSKLCRSMYLKSVVPSYLLSTEMLVKFCICNKLPADEAMKILNASIYDFLIAFSGNSGVFRNVFDTHLHHPERISSPLQPNYEPGGFYRLLHKDISLLPTVLLNALQIFVIRFTVFLIGESFETEFSEFSSSEQLELVARFCAGAIPGNSLKIPRMFMSLKRKVYENWSKRFEAKNVIQQIWAKAIEVDVILLQRVNKETFDELKQQFACVYSIIPRKFPAGEKYTTVICLLQCKVELQAKKKPIQLDQQNFAVLCKSYDILYWVGAVCLTDVDSPAQKRKLMTTLVRSMGTTRPMIFGGDFGFDLTDIPNAKAGRLLNNYNGINYDQRSPLRSRITRIRSHLNFQREVGGKPCVGVTDGIFSTFPLVDQAFTDVSSWGENASDHAPIFQEIQLGLF